MTEESLSDKIYHKGGTSGREEVIDICNIKEAIRILKERLCCGNGDCPFCEDNRKLINEIFGDKLI